MENYAIHSFKKCKKWSLTGIILSISRITGETAPLIMTILGTSLFFSSLTGPVDALPLRIWRLASQPYEYAHAAGLGRSLHPHDYGSCFKYKP